MTGYNIPMSTCPLDPEAPWAERRPSESREVLVNIRFTGVHQVKMTLPPGVDPKDRQAVGEALDQWTMDHRPDYAKTNPEQWRFFRWGLGEFWDDNPPRCYPVNGEAKIFIDDVIPLED